MRPELAIKAIMVAHITFFALFYVPSSFAGDLERMLAHSNTASADFATIFTDRTKLIAGDSTILYVILNPDYRFTDHSKVVISTSLNYTPIAGDAIRSPCEKRFKINSTRNGEYQILIQLINILKSDEESKFDQRKMLTLKILDKPSNPLGALAGVIIGVLIGLITSFVTTLFNELRQRKQKRTKQVNWVFNSLRPQILAAQKRIKERQEVFFAGTMKEFYELGCYSILEEISSKSKINVNLSDELIEINSLLDEYNNQLSTGKVSINQNLLNQLNVKMDSMIDHLGKKKGII